MRVRARAGMAAFLLLLPALARAQAPEPPGGFWLLGPPIVTPSPSKETESKAVDLDPCDHSVSASATAEGAQTRGKRRDPCRSEGNSHTGPITFFQTESFESRHAWSGLPPRARAGETVQLAAIAELSGAQTDRGGRSHLGGAGTAIVAVATGERITHAGSRWPEMEPGHGTGTFTFPAPHPRGDNVLRLVARFHGPGGTGEVVFRYTFVASADVERTLRLEAWDGENDPKREQLPLTLAVAVQEKGRPLAGAPVSLLLANTPCLARVVDVRDDGARSWRPIAHDFGKGPLTGERAPRTGADGRLVLRLRLDFDRLAECPFPIEIGARVSTPADAAGALPPLTQDARLRPAHAAFHFGAWYHEVGADGNGPWRELGSLRRFTPDVPRSGPRPKWVPDDKPQIEEPTRPRARSRILLNGEAYPEPGERTRFVPIADDTFFQLDATGALRPVPEEGPGAAWGVPRQHGLAMAVYWLDGSVGVFQVHNRAPEPSVLYLRFLNGPEQASSGLTASEFAKGWAVRFLVGQAGDFVVRTAAWGAAGMIGGPLAAVIVEGIVGIHQAGEDVRSAGQAVREIDERNAQLVIIRSTVSVTRGKGGALTLYNFEGEPGVMGRDGLEVAPRPGEAVDFTIGGAIARPEARPAPAEALALVELARTAEEALPPATSGPAVPATATAGKPGAASAAAGPVRWLLVGLVALVASALLLGLVLVGQALRRRPAARSAPAPAERPATTARGLRLVALDGACAGRAWPVGANLRLGREADNDVVLADDAGVSRHHAVIQRFPEGWSVADLGSANGTCLDGTRLTAPVWLAAGQLLSVGRTRFRVEPD